MTWIPSPARDLKLGTIVTLAGMNWELAMFRFIGPTNNNIVITGIYWVNWTKNIYL